MGENLDNTLNDFVAEMPGVTASAEMITQKFDEVKQDEQASEKPSGKATGKKRGPYKKRDGAAPSAGAGDGTSRLGGIADSGQRAVDMEAARRDESIRATASYAVGVMEQTGIMLGGDAGRMAEPERMGLEATLGAYMKLKNIPDIPPGIMLLMLCGQYYGRVAATPVAVPKLQRFGLWLKTKFSRGKNFAYANRRNDIERKDNSSKDDPASVQAQERPLYRS